MYKKYIIISSLIVIAITITFLLISNTSFAYQYDIDENYTLFYKENEEELKNDIEKYLTTIDNFLIPNSTFEISNTLKENYPFLVNFSIDYINNNYEYYKDKIITHEEYTYNGINFSNKKTNKYIPIEEIYIITNKYFNTRDFQIINDNVKIIDNYISLSDYTEEEFQLKILSISLAYTNTQVLAQVTYENNCKYLYTFDNVKNILKINNIEVVEWKEKY